MVSYDWIIEQMEAYPEYDGFQNVVFTIHWRCNASEDDYSATGYGSVGVQYEAGSDFTEYADLTKEQVVGWVKATLGDEYVTQLETALANEIDAKRNPKSIVNPLPWSA